MHVQTTLCICFNVHVSAGILNWSRLHIGYTNTDMGHGAQHGLNIDLTTSQQNYDTETTKK